MKMQFLSGITILALTSVSAMAQKGSADRVTGTSDSGAFMVKAAEGGLAEVELGKLAQTHASSDAVKNFGKRMVHDHTRINAQLSSIAAQRDVALPTKLDSEDRATVDRLSLLKGPQFDQAYMADMVRDHRGDIVEFRREAKYGADSATKQFAATNLPMLKDHLRQAKDARKQVK
jgi:putative membrane protein